jgi:hypothetical protein
LGERKKKPGFKKPKSGGEKPGFSKNRVFYVLKLKKNPVFFLRWRKKPGFFAIKPGFIWKTSKKTALGG